MQTSRLSDLTDDSPNMSAGRSSSFSDGPTVGRGATHHIPCQDAHRVMFLIYIERLLKEVQGVRKKGKYVNSPTEDCRSSTRDSTAVQSLPLIYFQEASEAILQFDKSSTTITLVIA